MSITLLHGDCLDLLPTLEANSVDTVIADVPSGTSFMGKKWDNKTGYIARTPKGLQFLECGELLGLEPWEAGFVAFMIDVLTETYRVMKPGAMCLIWALPRTADLTGLAMRVAGLEVRDTITHLTAQGFPKSMDISKAIDKTNGETQRAHKFTQWMRTTGLTSRQLDEATGTNMGGHYLTAKSQPAIPTPELWGKIRPMCGNIPTWVNELVERIEAEREVIGKKEWNNSANHFVPGEDHTQRVHLNITAPATPAAKLWDGYGTALKPAVEFWLLGMKPLGGTFANNAIVHGVAGLNIDGSRIPTGDGHLTGKRPYDILTENNGGMSWEDTKILCCSCAKTVESQARPTTQETKGSIAAGNADTKGPGKEKSIPGNMSRLDTGCLDGMRVEDMPTNSSIAMSGKKKTDRYQADSLSTTKTATRKTTESRTCNLCGAEIMLPITTKTETIRNQGRFPSNLILSHHPSCKRVGVRKVKAAGGDIAPGSKGTGPRQNSVYGKDKNKRGSWTAYKDADGLETIAAYDCHPECPIRLLGEQSGERKSGGGNGHRNASKNIAMSGANYERTTIDGQPPSSGTAARFFLNLEGETRFIYQAKPSNGERDLGLGDFYWRKDKSVPFGFVRVTREQWDALPEKERAQGNVHATVKSRALMAALCKLTRTPTGGVVLDFCMGSGSTGLGCVDTDRDFIGMERDRDSFDIAQARITHAQNEIVQMELVL